MFKVGQTEENIAEKGQGQASPSANSGATKPATTLMDAKRFQNVGMLDGDG